jgi:CheY-like chemotaxis protein
LVARDGLEGVDVFVAHQQVVDVVVLDLTMPKMGGLEVAGVLRGLRPELPIVLMSGYTVEELKLESPGLVIAGFVQKPFRALNFLAAIRHALGR